MRGREHSTEPDEEKHAAARMQNHPVRKIVMYDPLKPWDISQLYKLLSIKSLFENN